jgi:trehalose 6-phosphate phosphatase
MHWQALKDILQFTQAERLGIITDVDGTISPIVANADDAEVTPIAKSALNHLSQTLPLVAVISGRSAADVHERVGVEGVVYIGNHGMERWRDSSLEMSPAVANYRPNIRAAVQIIRQHLATENMIGVWLEDKGATLSLHYREANDHEAIMTPLRPILQRIESEQGLVIFEGRMVFEIRPPVQVHKGTAFTALVKEYHLTSAVYIGDDTTDLDAMHAAQTLRENGHCYAVGIGVASPETPTRVLDEADYIAQGIPDVEAFLEWIMTLKS